MDILIILPIGWLLFLYLEYRFGEINDKLDKLPQITEKEIK